MQDLFGDVPKPEVDALGYLIKFARKAKGRAFSSEEVTLSALGQGIAFEELRAWGAVFSTAAKEGYIRRSDVLFKRAMGNGSLSPGWVGV